MAQVYHAVLFRGATPRNPPVLGGSLFPQTPSAPRSPLALASALAG